ncbi:MAG TPA: N-acetylmuramoyl-L-alanine amidase-like domain-containing protein [Pseudolabrys sp.]|nr:N-acetylmuramoyl-L-alanine amidase-like domain-containing protein [Pseudolabrys sp.]
MPSRRQVLQLAAGGALFAAGLAPARTQEPRITALIDKARGGTFIGERIGVISQALIGSRYVAYPLVGGPHKPEQFVLRDDAFDCVTFCETVLAAARSFAAADFAPQLRKIRYRDGEIAWGARNHYFADWALNNIANGICRAVVLPDAAIVEKTVSYMHGLPVERVGLTSIPAESVLANAGRLMTGDIAGFLSRRPGIDYFHTGFIVAGKDDALTLRHAAKSKGRVLDQPLAQFFAENGVQHLSLLRPQEMWTGEAIV